MLKDSHGKNYSTFNGVLIGKVSSHKGIKNDVEYFINELNKEALLLIKFFPDLFGGLDTDTALKVFVVDDYVGIGFDLCDEDYDDDLIDDLEIINSKLFKTHEYSDERMFLAKIYRNDIKFKKIK